ncbi:protein Z-dependent protease inhibitor-like protein [Lates japonicus]|uniref:Protein Z-dependent protease inhibitor-like protein n=1 Tax=Lates japonicus TaxID=270547 RepID=A0AAD3NGH9_LATJO|nr:protein Z-dependent protease inhibitor-like protein [Lates japonicus]
MMLQLSLIGSVQTPPSGSSLLLVLTSDQCLFLTPPTVGAMTMTPSAPSVLLLLLHHLLSPVSSQTVDPSVADLTNRNSDFAARLYRAVASRTDDNVFLSPFALTAGLTALLNATSGPTQDQLLQGLTLTGLDPQTLPDLFQTLRTTILQGGTATNLQQGMAVFPAQSFQVSSSYLDLVQTKFGGTAQSLAYTSPEQAINTINHWAQEQTGDQIKELVTNLDPQTQLLLATAASYQARFSPSFNSSLSQEERFYVDRYHIVMVTMMFRADKYFLAYDSSVKAGVLKLPMTDGMAMLVVLPDEDVDVTAVEEEVTAEKIQAWIKQLKKTKLEVLLPRFLLERSYMLKDVLQTLDITQVFQDNADITNMGGAKGPRLSQVFHKSIVSVDERGDDITAGGGVSIFSTLPPRLTINRPFIFIVYKQTTGNLLFMGRVVDPTKK